MPKAQLVFTRYKNSYKVDIPNLEELSVEQIKELQHFVSFRNGMFDFNNYSFTIQKTLEYDDFFKLINELKIEATCEENRKQFKEVARVGFGQYKGMPVSDLPDSYLLWLKNNYHGEQKDIFLAEISRRKL
ncbi:putative quorum-sensing-regulated virulence factor [Sulfurimonas sp.]|uniref:putative quorum-sensing-regulated virulence factor n=1 Tax=Sulfurimonas sp. TaxID=2022749 RepID=UPI00356861A3